jgi:hypothetical protein
MQGNPDSLTETFTGCPQVSLSSGRTLAIGASTTAKTSLANDVPKGATGTLDNVAPSGELAIRVQT